MHARALIGCVALVVACGARTEIAPPEGLDAGFRAHTNCASASGVRLCDNTCPPLAAPDCKGFGCTHPVALDGTTAPVGVCWADTSESDFLCDGCAAGDACLQRTKDEWVCVPADVCEALWDSGVTAVCRYADKRTYDHRPIPNGAGCPANETAQGIYAACGGDCPACALGDRCNGVAPDHPFGICNDGAEPYSPSHGCGTPTFCNGITGDVCAVPDVPSVDLDVARRYGTCMDQPGCFDFAKRFPGGLGCYDAAGHRLN